VTPSSVTMTAKAIATGAASPTPHRGGGVPGAVVGNRYAPDTTAIALSAGSASEGAHASAPPTARCSFCRAMILADAKFCDACGAEFVEPNPPEPPKCPTCGMVNREHAKFCRQCGTQVAGNQSLAIEGPSKPCRNCNTPLRPDASRCPRCGFGQ
jgi:hypothetical protein